MYKLDRESSKINRFQIYQMTQLQKNKYCKIKQHKPKIIETQAT